MYSMTQTAGNRYLEDPRENAAARDRILNEYIPYVRRVVGRMAIHLPNSVDLEDLVHAGIIGLIDAIDRFEPDRGNKFLTYALYRIRGAVLSELRSRDFLSRSLRRKIREMDAAFGRLEQRLGREPSDDELAEELVLDLDKLYEIKKMSSLSFVSLDSLGYGSGEDTDRFRPPVVQSELLDASKLTGLKELHKGLAEAIEALPEKEKLVVSLYYDEELTMREIGEVLGITESRISQIHSRAVMRLRERLRKRELIDG
jgi:RNA polymerase sigma factor for flagellar operon FliA